MDVECDLDLCPSTWKWVVADAGLFSSFLPDLGLVPVDLDPWEDDLERAEREEDARIDLEAVFHEHAFYARANFFRF